MTPLPALEIARLAASGDGVAHDPSGRIVFVAGALPGEAVEASLIEQRPRFARAVVTSVLRPSDDRRHLPAASDCAAERAGCGGCGMRHVHDRAALSLKAAATWGELRKLAPGVAWPDFTLHPSPALDGYRSRLSLHADLSGRVGLHRAGSRAVIDADPCLAACDDLRLAFPALRALAAPLSAPPQKWVVEAHGGRVWCAWKGASSPAQRAAARDLVAASALAAVRFVDAHHRVLSDVGDPWMAIPVTVADRALHYRRVIGSFGQANPAVNAALLAHVRAQVEAWGSRRVADLYAGSGNLTLAAACAPGLQEAWAVEVAPDGVEGTSRSAAASGLSDRVRVAQHDLDKPDAATRRALSSCDAVILDPPRTGALALTKHLASLRPPHILYISCSPPHMARDLAALGDAYEVTSLAAFDMFPRTPHLEAVASLRLR
jgi:23S rRNA (uracil1939-C5)-methyltransferase